MFTVDIDTHHIAHPFVKKQGLHGLKTGSIEVHSLHEYTNLGLPDAFQLRI